MVNNRTFEHRPISELMAIVRQDLRRLDEEGLIDEGTVIKVIMRCNEMLGLSIKEVKQSIVPVFEGKSFLPLDFDRLYYACKVGDDKDFEMEYKNPFDNSFDRDIIYEAGVDRAKFGGTEHYNVTIKKITNVKVKTYEQWAELEVTNGSSPFCMSGCPNLKRRGKETIIITKDREIICPFEKGEIYLMYVANMKDEEGNLLFTFHPLITPYYEWAIKEKLLQDAMFNSDGDMNILRMLKEEAAYEKSKAWNVAFEATTSRSYNERIQAQKKKELNWYNQYFNYFK